MLSREGTLPLSSPAGYATGSGNWFSSWLYIYFFNSLQGCIYTHSCKCSTKSSAYYCCCAAAVHAWLASKKVSTLSVTSNIQVRHSLTFCKLKTCGATRYPKFPRTEPFNRNRSGVGEHFLRTFSGWWGNFISGRSRSGTGK